MIWGYWDILSPKSHTRKIDKIQKDFELYQISMHNVMCQIVRIFPLYIYCLQEESIHFGLRVLKKFDLEVSGHFGQSIMQEKLPKFATIFELHQVLIRSKMS